MFKLALNAGHYKYTPGKRCHVDIDPKQTREWVLNDRICDKIQKILSEYDGIEVLRIDDTSGEIDISLTDRTNKANNCGADFWLGVHHNAAGKKFDGGGIVAYVYTAPGDIALGWQKDLYNTLIAKTGLKGNRSSPLAKKNLHEVRETKMPAVLLELGFMDSTVDCPIILTEEYADKCAEAISEVIVERAKLTKKKKTTVHYRVQVGAYNVKMNAENLAKKLKADGYEAIIVEAEGKAPRPEAVKVEAPKAEAPKPVIEEGKNVRLNSGAKTYTGGSIASWAMDRTYQVKQIKEDRVVLTYGGVVFAAVNIKDLTLV